MIAIDALRRLFGRDARNLDSQRQMLEKSRHFLALSTEMHCTFDSMSRTLVDANPMFLATTGYVQDELAGLDLTEVMLPAGVADGAPATIVAGGACGLTCRIRCKDDAELVFEWDSTDAGSGCSYAIARDVTQRRRDEEKLGFAATHDSLTGLKHLVLVEKELAQRLENAGPVWILFVGLDRFQAVNDSLDQLMGDDVLQRIAQRLQDALGDQGQIARYAGDEFLIVVASGLARHESIELAALLRSAVAAPLEGHDYRLLLTASVGVSHSPDHGDRPSELFRGAKAAMRMAKNDGRDTVREFSTAQMKALEDRRTLGRFLRGAIARNELHLEYQPQFYARNNRLSGFEALLRWNSPALGSVAPGRFIPIAETMGMMPEMGGWILRVACREARVWLDLGCRDFNLSVNVSAQQLLTQGLVRQIHEAMRESAIPAGMLEVELTESSMMENVPRIQQILGEVKALGVAISIDDFGTGYSSLAYLKHFQIDKLKIDQSFVRGLPADADDAAIARAIVAMAHQLRLTVTAEGVESEQQRHFLAGIGCDELQGYHLGRPMSAEAAVRLFER